MSYGDYPDLTKVRKVLVVKLRHLGDVLLTSPLFTHLKKAIPHARIDAYIYEEAKPMLEGHPAVSNLIGYDRQWKKLGFFRKIGKEISLLREIRKQRYDLVINLTEGDRGTLVAKISKAPLRLGFTPKGRWQKSVYTHIVKHCPGVRHTVERNLDALRRIGIFPGDNRDVVWFLESQIVEAMRLKIGKDPFIVIHPTSRWKFKCYPVDKMRAVVEELCKQGKRIVLTSGPDKEEIEMVEKIARGLNVEVFSGKTTLKELGALISLSSLLLCVDSVPLHMASALKKRVVVLFGPTSDITWGPWKNEQAKILSQPFSCRPCYQDGCGGSKHSDCLATIAPKRVLDAVNGELGCQGKLGIPIYQEIV